MISDLGLGLRQLDCLERAPGFAFRGGHGSDLVDEAEALPGLDDGHRDGHLTVIVLLVLVFVQPATFRCRQVRLVAALRPAVFFQHGRGRGRGGGALLQTGPVAAPLIPGQPGVFVLQPAVSLPAEEDDEAEQCGRPHTGHDHQLDGKRDLGGAGHLLSSS